MIDTTSLRDWHAARAGWIQEPDSNVQRDGSLRNFMAWTHKPTMRVKVWVHPFPPTIDGAASALREPWRLVSIDLWPGNVVAHIVRDHCGSKKSAVGPDELTARYRAAVASRMEGGKA